MNFMKESLWMCSFALWLLVSQCSENYYETVMLRKKNALPEDLVNVVSYCYFKTESIVLAGNWSNDDINVIKEISNSVILFYTSGMEENFHFHKHKRYKNVYQMTETVMKKLKYPGNTFILVIYDMNDLSKTFTVLKQSVLWNHQGDFFIICKNTEVGCRDARTYLELVWSYNILSATFSCYDKYNNAQIYTFNPYTNSAPNFWSVCCKNQNHIKSIWAVYRRALDPSLKNLYDIICQNLFFDKTRNLGGYTINAGFHRHNLFLPWKESHRKLESGQFGGFSGQLSMMIWNHLNATLRTESYSKSILADDDMSPKNFLRDLLKAKIEVTLNINMLRDFWKLQAYPHYVDEFCVVSRKRTPNIKLQDILPLQPEWFAAYCAIYLFLFVSLKYIAKRSYSYAFLESIRAMINSQFPLPFTNWGARYLLINFIFVTILLRINFQSHLSSFGVTPRNGIGIDTREDIIQSNLTMYGTLDYESYLRNLDIRNRYRFGIFKDCLNRLLNGQNLICLTNCMDGQLIFLSDNAEIYLHISKPIKTYYLSFSAKEDWPLMARFNKVMMSMSETGFFIFILRRKYYNLKSSSHEIKTYIKLSWANLKDIWYFWIVGLILATVVFLLEVALHKVEYLSTFSYRKRT